MSESATTPIEAAVPESSGGGSKATVAARTSTCHSKATEAEPSEATARIKYVPIDWPTNRYEAIVEAILVPPMDHENVSGSPSGSHTPTSKVLAPVTLSPMLAPGPVETMIGGQIGRAHV